MKSTQSKSKRREQKILNVYSRCLITRNVVLPITNIGKNMNQTIENVITSNYEGICLVEGYIKRGSAKVVSYSSGLIERGNNISFEVVFECEVCFPVEGTIISCVATNITKAGIKADSADELPSPIVVFIARDHHYNVSQFSNISEGTKFNARIIGQRFELNDKCISVIAELVQPKM